MFLALIISALEVTWVEHTIWYSFKALKRLVMASAVVLLHPLHGSSVSHFLLFLGHTDRTIKDFKECWGHCSCCLLLAKKWIENDEWCELWKMMWLRLNIFYFGLFSSYLQESVSIKSGMYAAGMSLFGTAVVTCIIGLRQRFENKTPNKSSMVTVRSKIVSVGNS